MNPKPQDIYGKIITGEKESWVLFQNGTCVVFTEPQADYKQAAVKKLREAGEARGGGESGDFSVMKLKDLPGWIVSYFAPGIFNYISPEEFEGGNPSDIAIGMVARKKRNSDSASGVVIHTEAKG
ncbi:MAG: hypothetical protein A2122_00910 [Candidatus Liptonbacteria bacterium GWB1_49_6]|uniref:Uncharacterized protein n=1 Tax=Candidatus Liptonbacteria bacterium GWB1_49_6 TaxID=1798644 RepID=A0A1G2C858_9BACT|nr:MAG: hypothetical protein A2122_00910 [Candidatus Liptonbacteria bacterium GWB1_49_6]